MTPSVALVSEWGGAEEDVFNLRSRTVIAGRSSLMFQDKKFSQNTNRDDFLIQNRKEQVAGPPG